MLCVKWPIEVSSPLGLLFKYASILFFQLESLPKEDLIKFVKKQMLMLQKTKAKNEGNIRGYLIYLSVLVRDEGNKII